MRWHDAEGYTFELATRYLTRVYMSNYRIWVIQTIGGAIVYHVQRRFNFLDPDTSHPGEWYTRFKSTDENAAIKELDRLRKENETKVVKAKVL